jgi:hypothetical protein
MIKTLLKNMPHPTQKNPKKEIHNKFGINAMKLNKQTHGSHYGLGFRCNNKDY